MTVSRIWSRVLSPHYPDVLVGADLRVRPEEGNHTGLPLQRNRGRPPGATRRRRFMGEVNEARKVRDISGDGRAVSAGWRRDVRGRAQSAVGEVLPGG